MVVGGGSQPEQEHPTVAQLGVARPGVAHLRTGGDGIWWVGREGAVTAIRDVKGLHYLRIM